MIFKIDGDTKDLIEAMIREGMYNWSPGDYGGDWECIFCNRQSDLPNQIIKHADDCRGERILRKLWNLQQIETEDELP